MTTDPNSAPSDDIATKPSTAGTSSPTPLAPRLTRASAIWVATGASLVLLILLIVFMLQNSTKVGLHFLGLFGTIPLGLALLIAAVGGGVLVGIAGMARVTQLRWIARRTRRTSSGT
ncbi:MAG TPA: lipopolysaccharide assembly protein LapA domain-containing protein [Pedococcus sp.]|jgi:uncharacterized integral membrane protein|nr:lipopolysaccharide assembly protein LapA domain-containing protein [Pedococcus sp.]